MKTFDDVYKTLPDAGWLNVDEARLLWRCCQETVGPILEVGCYKGRSTVLLAATNRIVHCVDPFDNFDDQLTGDQVEQKYFANLNERGITNVVHWRSKVEDWQPDYGTYGLCYLDGDHTYDGTLRQVETALTLNASIIAIHDVNDEGGGVQVKEAALRLLKRQWDERIDRMAVWRMK